MIQIRDARGSLGYGQHYIDMQKNAQYIHCARDGYLEFSYVFKEFCLEVMKTHTGREVIRYQSR